MLDSLTARLTGIFDRLRGYGRLTEENIQEALREVRVALLEADVNFKVVKGFIERVRVKAVGQDVLTSLTPGQQVVKVVRDELVELLGGSGHRLAMASHPPTVIMLVGLQGSGKTTSAAKLARHFQKQGQHPILASADVYRPAAIEQLRRLLVDTKFSRIPVYDGSLDEIIVIAFARELLQVPDRELAWRTVREIMRPALFVPETKLGSQLLKDMQQRNQQMAIVIDEYGSVAGLVTVEDLIEEIVGEIGEEDRTPAPDVVRESDGSLVMRGSVSLEKLQELFGIELPPDRAEDATTVAGLLNSIAGHVPAPGEKYDFDGLRFEVLEANQRKVLRLRARRQAAALPA